MPRLTTVALILTLASGVGGVGLCPVAGPGAGSWPGLATAGAQGAQSALEENGPRAETAGDGAGAVAGGWSDSDTALVRSAFQMFEADPSYGRVTDLLWEVYAKHDQVDLLLESLAAQVGANPLAGLLKGHVLRRHGDLAAAADAYDRFLQAKPDHVHGTRARAQLAAQTGDPDLAVALFSRLREVVAGSPDELVEVLLELADAHDRAGDREQARERWLEAVDLRPGDHGLRERVGRELARSGDLEAAAVQFRLLAEQGDAELRANALTELARYLELDADAADAAEVMWQVLEMTHHAHPRHVAMLRRLVRLHEREGTLDGLQADLERRAADGGGGEAALLNLTRFHQFTVQPGSRLESLRRLVDRFPGIDYELELIDVLLEQDQRAEAAERLDALLAEGPAPGLELVLMRARLEILEGERDTAAERLSAWLGSASRERRAEGEGRLLAFAREFRLRPVVEQILDHRAGRDRDNREAVFELAGWWIQQGAGERAGELLEEWIEGARARTPEELDQRLRDGVGFALGQQQLALAEELAGRRLEGGHDPAGAMTELAEVLARQERLDEAAEMFHQAIAHVDDLERVADIDERLHSLLLTQLEGPFSRRGFSEPQPRQRPDPRTSFTLPALPGQDPDEDSDDPDNVITREAERAALAADEEGSVKNLYRAAWWALKVNDHGAALGYLRQRMFDQDGRRQTAELPFERMLLEVARADQENPLLVRRQLALLRELDPANEAYYLRGEAEHDLALGVAGAAERLERWIETDSNPLPLLEMLTLHFEENSMRDRVVPLWERTYRRADRAGRARLIDRYARVLQDHGRAGEALRTQTELIVSESNPARRRELFDQQMRLIEGAMFASGNDAHAPLLETLTSTYREAARRQPLEPFFDEALAVILRAAGDARGAFQSMQRAYYKSDGDPARQGPLRDAALAVGDLEAAVYFQRQLVADSAANDIQQWQELVALLERQLRFDEADQVRQRMESRFANNAATLAELADDYEQRAGLVRAIELREALLSLEPDDLVNRHRLARLLVFERRFDEANAVHRTIWDDTRGEADAAGPRELPLWDSRSERRGSAPTHLLAEVEAQTLLSRELGDAVIAWLEQSSDPLASEPDQPAALRLRSLEQWSRLRMIDGFVGWQEWYAGLGALNPVERMWAASAVRQRTEVAAAARELLAATDLPEEWFGIVMAAWRGGGSDTLFDWATGVEHDPVRPPLPPRILVAALQAAVADACDAATPADLRRLVEHDLVGVDELAQLAASYATDDRYRGALAAGDLILELHQRLDMGAGVSAYAVDLHRWAERIGDEERQVRYLEFILEQVAGSMGPQDSRGGLVGRDLFLEAYRQLRRRAVGPAEKAALDRRVGEMVAAVPDPLERAIRQSAVMAKSGNVDDAARQLGEALLAALGQGGLREIHDSRRRMAWSDDRSSRRSAELGWTSVYMLGEALRAHGLNDLATRAMGHVAEVFGALHLGAEPPVSFAEFRHLHALQRMQATPWPERGQWVREQMGADDNVYTRLQLGDLLTAHGFAREALPIFQDLVPRAPSSVQYAEGFLDAAEASWEHAAALEYLDRMFATGFEIRPQGINEIYVRAKHAAFLVMDGDIERLHKLAFEADPPNERELRRGREPEAVSYMHQLIEWHRLHHDIEALVEVRERLLRFQPDNYAHLADWAAAMLLAGRDQEALERVEEALQHEHLDEFDRVEQAMAWLALQYSLLQREDEFTGLVRRAMDEGSFMQLETIGSRLLDEGREADAVRVLDAAVRVPDLQPLYLTDALARRLAAALRLAGGDGLDALGVTGDEARAGWIAARVLDLLRALDVVGHSGWDQEHAFRLSETLRTWAGTDPEAAALLVPILRQQLPSPGTEDLRSAVAGLLLTVLAPATGTRVDSPVRQALARTPSIYPDVKAAAVTALHRAGMPEAALAAWRELDPGHGGRIWSEPLFLPALVELQGVEALDDVAETSLQRPYPGSAFSANLPETLESMGRPDLARRLFEAYLEDLESSLGVDPVVLVRAVEFHLRNGDARAAGHWLQRRGHQFAADVPRLALGWWRLTSGGAGEPDERVRHQFALTDAQWREFVRLNRLSDDLPLAPERQVKLYPLP